MHVQFYITLFMCLSFTNGDEYESHNLTINEISDNIVNLFGNQHEQKRIKELKQKIDKINSYVISNDVFYDLLQNVTSRNNLTETNFYESLLENDHFRFITRNNSDNLYLKLKSKMNRDDIMMLLATKGEKGKLKKSARRMMRKKYHKSDDDHAIHDVVDKIIGEVPKDDHKIKANESIYWDPQGAAEDLKEYYDSKRDGRRIFKGERTNIRDWPFMVSIHVMGTFWCGGALYWNDLVITSASCLQLLHNNRFFRENPRVLQVRIGSNHSRLGGELVDVLEVYFHPGYNPKTLHNNLAVTRLRRHLAFSYHRLPKIIPISDLPTSIPATAELLVLGWGVTKSSQRLSYEPIFLQKKYMPVYPNTFCKEVYGNKFITDRMFCAGTLTTGEGACDHDAGGPAVLGGRLVGIISFGPTVCGITNAPTVFTLIGAFTDWIENVNESMPLYYRGKRPTTSTTLSDIGVSFSRYAGLVVKNKLKETPSHIEPFGLSKRITTTPMVVTAPDDIKIEMQPEAAEPGNQTTTSPVTETTTASLPPKIIRNDDSDADGWNIESSR